MDRIHDYDYDYNDDDGDGDYGSDDDDDGLADHDVDDWTGLRSLEEVEKPIEPRVVPVNPDQLQSEMKRFRFDHMIGFLDHNKDLTSEPIDASALYRATTEARIDANGVIPIPVRVTVVFKQKVRCGYDCLR